SNYHMYRQLHRHGGIVPQAQLDHRHDQRHAALSMYADEGVRGKDGRRRSRGPGGATRERQRKIDDEAANGGGTRLEETAAIERWHQGVNRHGRSSSQPAARWIAARIR